MNDHVYFTMNAEKISSEPPPSSADVRECEIFLGINFPIDFKEFIFSFGCCYIDEFIRILDLSKSDGFYSVRSQMNLLKGNFYDQVNKGWHFHFDHASKDRFIPFAVTDNGSVICWMVRNDGRSVTEIAVIKYRPIEVVFYDLTFSGFIRRFIEGEIKLDGG